MSRHLAITASEAISGYLAGVAIGAVLAVFSSYVPAFGRAITPYGVALKTTPIIVLAPLLIMWLGNGYLSKVIMAAMSAFFPVYVSTCVGLSTIDQEWLDLLALHKASRWQTLIYLRIPNAMPHFFSGCRIASSLALV
ncbi:MAG TPA: ABC transporter permease subunit, partial [Schlesneria sp.]